MKKLGLYTGIVSLAALTACQTVVEPVTLKAGQWVGSMTLNDSVHLPFNMKLVETEAHDVNLYISNAGEEIEVKGLLLSGDSLNFEMPVFESEFNTILRNDSLIGTWTKYHNSKYAVPFIAVAGQSSRYAITEEAKVDANGKWAITFSPGVEGDEYPAIGNFQQEGNKLIGTIITETGDYRFLDGVVNGNQFQLSTFDGAHAFAFEGYFDSNGQMNGRFYSGTTWSEPFVGNKDAEAVLRSPDQLTFLKEGYEALAFAFPDLNGDTVRLSDYAGKAVIVQILGSWCPNCMDETRYYVELRKKFPELEIIGLAYERSAELAEAAKTVSKMKADLGVNYPVLIAGTWSKKLAAETLPMLNHVMSFPTSIYIDKSGAIQRIHTGFYGPGTGEYYEKYVDETESLIRRMLAE